jgi:hypothetical protein
MPIATRRLSFFAILRRTSDGETLLRRIVLEQSLQAELSARFIEMATSWRTDYLVKVAYTPTFVAKDNEVISVNPYDISDPFKTASTAVQQFEPLKLPIETGLTIRGIVAIQLGKTAEESLYLFQVLDQQRLLGRKFTIFLHDGMFWKLTDAGLMIGDYLTAVIEDGELLFTSHYQANKLLDLSHLYREATNEEIRGLIHHSTFALPKGVPEDTFLDHCNTMTRRKIHAVLDAGVLDDPEVTADRIKAYAHKYHNISLELKIKSGERKIELPADKLAFQALIRCLDQEFYTSELTHHPCQTNSYRRLDLD